MREIFGPPRWERKLFVFMGASLIMTVLGPFGTAGGLTFWERLVYWLLVISGVGFFMHIGVSVALKTALLQRLNQFFRIAIGTVVGALPGAAVVVFIDMMIRESGLTPDSMPLMWLQVAVVGYIISVVEFADWGGRPSEAPVAKVTRLQRRLPLDAGQIVSLSMQDHYVEVTSEKSKELILLRLSDAIDELDGLEGMQIHRSHWVALSHVCRVEKAGHRSEVHLTDGRVLPVSGTYAPSLSERLAARV